MVKIKVKALKIGNSVRVAIPSEVLEASGIRAGDTLSVDYEESSHTVVLHKEKSQQ